MALHFEIYSGSGEPIYGQIEAHLRRAIATGALREGEQLPSVRALAEQLTVNPNTVSRAYNGLVTEGLLESQPGRGMFVARRRQMFALEERMRRLDDAVERFANEAAFLDFDSSLILKKIEKRLTVWSQSGKPVPTPKKP